MELGLVEYLCFADQTYGRTQSQVGLVRIRKIWLFDFVALSQLALEIRILMDRPSRPSRELPLPAGFLLELSMDRIPGLAHCCLEGSICSRSATPHRLPRQPLWRRRPRSRSQRVYSGGRMMMTIRNLFRHGDDGRLDYISHPTTSPDLRMDMRRNSTRYGGSSI